MLNPGGEHIMASNWRIAVRQAEEAIRAGRLEEAYAYVNQGEVAEHQQAVQLRGRIALELIARGSRRAQAFDYAGAIEDLNNAERFGAPPDALASARLRTAEQLAPEIKVDLEAGRPERVVERIEKLSREKIHGPALARMREIADAWRLVLADARRGEFGRGIERLERAERLAAECSIAALASTRNDLLKRQEASQPLIERLYRALGGENWGEILAAAEAVLNVVPEHPAALQGRTRAWRRLAAIAPNHALPHAPAARNRTLDLMKPAASDWKTERVPNVDRFAAAESADTETTRRGLGNVSRSGPRGRFLLWADSIGGFLVCLNDQIMLGRADADGRADVPLLGDLSRRHASIVRDGDGYVVKAIEPTFVNGRRVETAPLRDHDIIRLGSTVEIEFRKPSPLSATATLTIVSRHRLPLAVDGIVLMAETCIVGRSLQAHIHASELKEPVVLYRQGESLWFRAAGGFEVDGAPRIGRAPITLRSNVLGEGFSFSLEPLESPQYSDV
jgi:tetratricopeptide (TPR) repeat protein